eukprot:m.338402 g.338402  ORF g.338402 m.338402 type:complete len:60 (+) comp18403_c0_seq1:2480-2659(+)
MGKVGCHKLVGFGNGNNARQHKGDLQGAPCVIFRFHLTSAKIWIFFDVSQSLWVCCEHT